MDRKYTDADVRGDMELRVLAVKYLRQYHGNFEFLVSCKQALLDGQALKEGTIRGILNCMLADPNVINMPEPAKSMFDAGEAGRFIIVTGPAPVEYKLEMKKTVETRYPYFPRRIKTSTKINYAYGLSLAAQACLIHVVDRDRSGLFMYAAPDPFKNKFMWELYWKCSQYRIRAKDRSVLRDRYRLVRYTTARTIIRNGSHYKYPEIRSANWKWCRQCLDSEGLSSHGDKLVSSSTTSRSSRVNE